MPRKPDEDLPINDPRGARDLKRLYAMTRDESMEEQKAWKMKDHPGARFPIERWAAAQELKAWRERHETGDKAAILEGIYLCTLNDLPIPRWCAIGFLQAFRDVKHYRAKSWDDVWGKPHAKGTQLEAKRQQREMGVAVFLRIKELHEKDPRKNAIDGFLFETVGRELGIGGKTLTEDLYYQTKKRLETYLK